MKIFLVLLLTSFAANAAPSFCYNGKIAKSIQRKYGMGIDIFYLRNTNHGEGLAVGQIPSNMTIRFNMGISYAAQPINFIVAEELGGVSPYPRLHPDVTRYWAQCGKIHVGGPMTMGCLKQQTYNWLSQVFCSGRE